MNEKIKNKLKKQEEKPKVLYTIVADYYEQGCGTILMGVIGYAHSKNSALKLFKEHFDEYYAIDAKISKGVKRNEISKYLFTEEVFEFLIKHEGKGNLLMHSELRFNFA